VEPQSETVWRQADKYNVPRICFVNKMDKLGADFYYTIDTIVKRLGAKPLIIQLPIGFESSFVGVIDLIEMNAKVWPGDSKGDVTLGAEYVTEAIPADLQTKAEEYRAQLVEAVAEASDELLEKFLSGEEISIPELKAGIRSLTIAGAAYPVFVWFVLQKPGCSAHVGRRRGLLASPLDVPAVEGHDVRDAEKIVLRKPESGEPFSALAFKVAVHPFFGRLTYIRVYSGGIDSGAQVINSTKDKKERIGKIFQMHANKENPVDSVSAGHIYAVIGLKDTTTGDTLCDPGSPVVLESMTFPEPVIEVAIEPKTKADQEKLSLAIQKLAEEDPTFRTEQNVETGQTVIKGMGGTPP